MVNLDMFDDTSFFTKKPVTEKHLNNDFYSVRALPPEQRSIKFYLPENEIEKYEKIMEKNKERHKVYKSLDDLIKEKFNGLGFIEIHESDWGAINYVHVNEKEERRVNINPCRICGIVEGDEINLTIQKSKYRASCYSFCGMCGNLLEIGQSFPLNDIESSFGRTEDTNQKIYKHRLLI